MSLKTNKGSLTAQSRLPETSSPSTQRSLPFEARRLLKRVQTFASLHALWHIDSRILIAVSGGPDSRCLMDMLVFLRKKYRFTIAIAHVNYQLRGKDSLSDERFVRQLSKTYDIPCFIKRYPWGSEKKDEQSLRSFRYVFFESLAKKHHFDTIALGHQMNDQAETFLMNLLRGSGLIGLSAMLPKHGLRIRPLMTLKREEILRYLRICDLNFQTDTSNTDTRYTRNRIRHELLPLLEKRFNPNIISTLDRSANLFQKETLKQNQEKKNITKTKRKTPKSIIESQKKT